MTRSTARWLVVIGAVGVLTIGTVALAGGHLGNGPTRVIESCAPSDPRGSVVHVTLSDRGGAMMGAGHLMMVSLGASPDSVRAGAVTFIATNVGALTHELLVLPAPRDGVGTRAVGADGTIDESSSLGEASTSCGEGHGDGISPGTSSWVTLTLTRGSYELLCDVPWHYANGMFTPFIVR